jgi:predicted DsbA family dithiol-disulfide isomerase
MSLTIPIAHDFICPWCWVGLLQARRLQQEFDAVLEWRGYELFPDELEWPDYPAQDVKTDRPPTPSRFEFLLFADGLVMPKAERPKKMRTHNAHEAVEYAKTEGVADQFLEALYRAYWEQGIEINDPKVLNELAKTHIHDRDAMMAAIENRRFKGDIVGFDDDAHQHGVWNVPTFFIGGQRLAEQPYVVLKHALEEGG